MPSYSVFDIAIKISDFILYIFHVAQLNFMRNIYTWIIVRWLPTLNIEFTISPLEVVVVVPYQLTSRMIPLLINIAKYVNEIDVMYKVI